VTTPTDCHIATLGHEGLLLVQGPDSAAFLQGQLTCDVRDVTPERALPGAYCTPQGRVVCDFLLAQTAPDTLALRMGADILERAATTLGKYIIFSKAGISRGGSDWQLYGCWGAGAPERIRALFGGVPDTRFGAVAAEAGLALRLDDAGQRFECWLRSGPAAEQLAAAADAAAGGAWRALDIAAGIGRIESPTVEEFVPQVLNYDLTGHVSFRKGCYPGQEVVARLHYRGTPKRRLYPAQIETTEPAPAGTPLFGDGDGRSLGTLVNAVREGTGVVALATITLAEASRPLRVGSADGPLLQPGVPPYPLSAS
jgi:folate-binding protein YgfZ